MSGKKLKGGFMLFQQSRLVNVRMYRNDNQDIAHKKSRLAAAKMAG
ncbi:hypothetical protein H4N55_15270 [Aeromonas veronii]|nr:hypothetical protein [Aeromonas veronii]MBF3237960.1 hypothetical protein [Aeromonas veronii]